MSLSRSPILRLTLAALFASTCSSSQKQKQEPASDAMSDAISPCAGTDPPALMACVDKAKLAGDVEAIALERVPGSSHWQSIQDLCQSRLEEFGYEVSLVDYGTGVNVIGRLPGQMPESGEVIVSAHYDHILGCPGADDNASGIAATLEIARLLADKQYSHPLVIACWDEEELGLIGSKAYAEGTKADGGAVSAMFSFDGIAFISNEPNSQGVPTGFNLLFPDEYAELEDREFRGDYIALIADEASAPVTTSFASHAQSVGLTSSVLQVPEGLKLASQTADLRRSDHASFWANDYTGILVTDTANFRNPNYHCLDGIDLPGTLDMDFLKQVTQATLGAALDALVPLPDR